MGIYSPNVAMKMKKTVLSSLDDLNFQRQIVACKFLYILYHVISNNKTFLGCSFNSLFKASELAFQMPSCFDGRAYSEDHRAHVAYTLNGEVAGELYVTFV